MEEPFDNSKTDNQFLESLRHLSDPLADNTVSKIISSGTEKQVNEVFMTLVKNDGFSPGAFAGLSPQLTDILNKYFEDTGQLPDWAEKSLITAGEEVFIKYGPEIFMLLNISSLPMCYTCAKGAQVLYDTSRLLAPKNNMDPLSRRLMETAQMIVNVMSPGGLSKAGKGIVTIQKVRLIHACIRYFLKEKGFNGAPWDVSKFGVPINQEDLAGTLMSFSPVILNGLKHLNIKLTPSETKAYSHCWKVVGHLMGIESALLPDTYEQGMELATKILKHQAASSDAGKALTNSCISFINYLMPGNTFDDVARYLMDFFLKDFSDLSEIDLSECIGVKVHPDFKDKILLSLTRYITGKIGHLEDHKLVEKITRPFNKFLLQGIINHFNDGKRVHFFLPPSLQKDWDLMEEWDTYKVLGPTIFKNRIAWQKQAEIPENQLTSYLDKNGK